MFALAFGLLLAAPAVAQDEGKGSLKSYNFVEAQGGIQFTPTDANTGKLITPMASLSFGRFFAPAVGARLHVSGWESKSGATTSGTTSPPTSTSCSTSTSSSARRTTP